MGSLYIFCILCSKTPRFWDLTLLFKIVIYIVGPNNAMFVLGLSLDIISIEFQKIFVIKKLFFHCVGIRCVDSPALNWPVQSGRPGLAEFSSWDEGRYYRSVCRDVGGHASLESAELWP